ncbi:hypothetical protein [Sphingopyxis solisilvae]|uniref:hypothetical protein n=1 Tax=Sphingopyxis solisilvae TaxID=1886788 RepID=UPI001892BC68|nr:hypothetical protein [Sphingopyxis solisilvae]
MGGLHAVRHPRAAATPWRRAEGSDDPSRLEVIACFLVPARAGSVGQGMTTQRQQRRRVAATLLLGVIDAER